MFCGESYNSLQNLQILIKCDILGTSVGLERQCLVACTTNYKMNNVMVNLLLWTTLILRYLDPDFGSWIWNLVLVSGMQIQFLSNKCSLHFPVVLLGTGTFVTQLSRKIAQDGQQNSKSPSTMKLEWLMWTCTLDFCCRVLHHFVLFTIRSGY